jgi:hypothetical protein
VLLQLILVDLLEQSGLILNLKEGKLSLRKDWPIGSSCNPALVNPEYRAGFVRLLQAEAIEMVF